MFGQEIPRGKVNVRSATPEAPCQFYDRRESWEVGGEDAATAPAVIGMISADQKTPGVNTAVGLM
jgi:hypothetical protein